MKIFIENQQLNKNEVSEYIPNIFLSPMGGNVVKCKYIGYIKKNGKDPVVILPKVFDNTFVQKYYKGEKEACNWMHEYIVTQYIAIKKYSSCMKHEGQLPENIKQSSEVTYLDVAMAVTNFYNKHRYLRNLEHLKMSSINPSNICWDKMINRRKYKIIDDEIFFDEFEKKRLGITNNDFLLRLLNTEVKNIGEVLGIISLDKDDEVLDKKTYRLFLKKPLKNLKLLKKKYFRDEYLKLIKILYNYYNVNKATSGKNKYEFLLTNNFELVFENMVDEFLSNEYLVQAYKYNKDGKILDHIYEDKDLISRNDFIYIGDSKYYTDIKSIKSTRWKQYTYAKNIQNYILTECSIINMKYREAMMDKSLYGYNIIPNFFISPYVNQKPYEHTSEFFSFNRDEKPLETFYFVNRLFDRDTLYIFYYDIDLNFLMNGYVKGFRKEKCTEAKNIVRNSIINYLNECYIFYIINEEVDTTLAKLKQNYYLFQGKVIYCNEKNEIILALKNNVEHNVENTEIVNTLIHDGVKLKPHTLV